MYTLDLCFAASFTVCAEWMKLEPSGHGASSSAVGRFFLLFLPLARLWDHTNSLFNRFDVRIKAHRHQTPLAYTTRRKFDTGTASHRWRTSCLRSSLCS